MSSGKVEPLRRQTRPSVRYDGGVIESTHSGRWVITPVRHWRYRGRSPYQVIDVGDVDYLGTCLFLDGWMQLAAVDEYVYHEHLVLPALLAHERPERVLILGGGDGLAAREVLRHAAVRQVIMVDLDAEVVRVCREHLADLQRGALDDPRVHVIIGDARDFLRNHSEGFDVVIVDLVDLMPDTVPLFEDVFAHVRRVLRPGGLVVSHGPDPGPPLHEGLFMVAFMKDRFPHVAWYKAFITSFGETWTFVIASDEVDVRDIGASQWQAATQHLDAPPRSFVAEAMPAAFLLTREEEAILERIWRQEPGATPPLGEWEATAFDGATMERLQELVGFSRPGPERR